jgi:putative ABC transport system substrate-binding protein
MVNRRKVVFTLVAGVVTPLASFAQQPSRIPMVGMLGGGSHAANATRVEAFRQGIRELGYVEGKNIIFEQRWADEKLERLPALAAELVRLKAGIIVSAGPTVTRAIKDANIAIPVVMGFDDDPVSAGFVASLARPGGNITGLSSLSTGLSAKQLDVLKEIVPKLARVSIIGSLSHPGTSKSMEEIESAAKSLQIKHQFNNVLEPKDLEPAFAAIRSTQADAVIVLTSVVTNSNRRRIVELAARHRVPAMYYTVEWAEIGGLLVYGASYPELFRRAATYVDKILKGAKPGDLPVEQPTKFDLIVNAKTAHSLGLKVPETLLLQATKVIK